MSPSLMLYREIDAATFVGRRGGVIRTDDISVPRAITLSRDTPTFPDSSLDVSVLATGVEMFKKTLTEGQAGDNVGILVRGLKREEVMRGQVVAKPGTV